MAVAITRTDLDAAGLRREAGLVKDSAAARRMLALALVLEGSKRADAARLCGMDRQTLRDWVHRYNDEGLAGLVDRKTAGPAPRLSPEQRAKVAALVRNGPSLEEHGVVRWRRADLSKVILTKFDIRLAERSVGTLLRRLGFTRLSVRPRTLNHDPQAQSAHKKTLPTWLPPRSRSTPATNQSSFGGKTKQGLANRAP